MASITAKHLVLLLHRCWLVGVQSTREDVRWLCHQPRRMAVHCSSHTLFPRSLIGASVSLQAGPYYPCLTAKETRAQESYWEDPQQSYLSLGAGEAGGMILTQRKVQDPCVGSPSFTHLSLQAEADPPKTNSGSQSCLLT